MRMGGSESPVKPLLVMASISRQESIISALTPVVSTIEAGINCVTTSLLSVP